MALDKKRYIVNADGWVAGNRAKKNDKVLLTEAQAKYENVTLDEAQPRNAAKPGDDAQKPKKDAAK